jgi:hypothetical protein
MACHPVCGGKLGASPPHPSTRSLGPTRMSAAVRKSDSTQLKSRLPRNLFIFGLALNLLEFIGSSVRNPTGIPDNSPWNKIGIALVLIGFACALAAPLFSDRSWEERIGLAVMAGAVMVALWLVLIVLSFWLFGMPVQG